MKERLTRLSLFFLFLKLIQVNFIFADNVCILSIYMWMVSTSCDM